MQVCNRQLLYLLFTKNGIKKSFLLSRVVKYLQNIDFTSASGRVSVFDDVIKQCLCQQKYFK